MVFAITREQREDLISRMESSLFAIGFHCHGASTSASTRSKAEEIEQRAFGAAEVSSSTTSGDRPLIEVMRLYVKKAAELMQEAVESAASATDAGVEDAEMDGDEFDVSKTSKDREFYTQQRAEQVLAPLLKKGATYSKVRLSTKSFGIDAAKVASRAFSNLAATLKEVDLSDTIAGRPEVEALKAMEIFSEGLTAAQLTSVDLSDNAFGEKGVRACTKLLQEQKELTSIAFLNNGISEQAARAIHELLACPEKLTRFHLDKNMTGDDGTKHIAAIVTKAKGMKDFKMAGSRFFSDGAIMLAKALSEGNSLERLDLNDNNVNEEGAEALAQVLPKHPNLHFLNLEATALGPDMGGALLHAVAKGCPKLEVLHVSSNDFEREGAEGVAQAIAEMKNLKVLTIGDNILGDYGFTRICMALSYSEAPLVRLDASCNELTKAGALAAARLAASKPGFESLNLDGNMIPEDAIEEVQAIMKAAGIENALMPMEDNDPEGEPDDDEGETGDMLAALASRLSL
jgi:Ran GTPase-activating protein 1